MRDDAERPAPPLAGLKVLDFTLNLPGPYATFVLASLGADVVKVEPPRGDPGRNARALFTELNRGKRSVVLDLRDAASRPALAALVGWADVIVEGFRPGVMGRLGCDFDAARAINPTVLYCSISAFGQRGPRADEPGHDLNLQALTGVCHLEREADERPRGAMLPIADLSAGLLCVASICAARASGPGEARHLDVAMADGALSFAHVWGTGVDVGGQVDAAVGKLPAPGIAARLVAPLRRVLDRRKLYAMSHYGLYRCRDDRWLALGIVDERHFWEALVDTVGGGLQRFRRLPLPARTAIGPLLRALIARRLRQRDRDHWLATFREAEVPATPVLRPGREVRAEPQFAARGAFDAQGHHRAPLPGAVHLTGPAPTLGEHTAAILAALGVDAGGR